MKLKLWLIIFILLLNNCKNLLINRAEPLYQPLKGLNPAKIIREILSFL